MTTLVLTDTAEVVMANVTLEAPAATVTLAGTEATDGFALLRFTNAPPLGAAPVNVTLPCNVLPPTAEVGVKLTAERLAGVGVGGVEAALAVNRREDEKEPA